MFFSLFMPGVLVLFAGAGLSRSGRSAVAVREQKRACVRSDFAVPVRTRMNGWRLPISFRRYAPPKFKSAQLLVFS